MKKIAFIALLLAMLAGCIRSEDGRIAQVGNHILYQRDIRRLLPEGISAEDSAAMVQQYINTWAMAHLKLLKAEEVLSAEEKDITAEVEDYRLNLLKYRLERKITDSQLDTTVTDGQQLFVRCRCVFARWQVLLLERAERRVEQPVLREVVGRYDNEQPYADQGRQHFRWWPWPWP